MKKLSKSINRLIDKKWAILTILLLGALASRTLFKHNFYFNMHDDLQMMRQLQLEKCILDFQFPCRWVGDMGYGFGLPLFNYYPQLPYLTGEFFRIFGLPFNDVAKLNFALGIIGSGFAMYLLSKEFFGKLGGLVSAGFYIWAPYRAVDVYVRGAMNESWAWIFFPLILLTSYKVLTAKNQYTIPFAVSCAGLLLTHNLMAFIFAPVVLLWVFYWIVKAKVFGNIIQLGIGGLFALCLSAFFTLPAIFEQKFVHISTLTSDYFQYFAHFATFRQLFLSRYWGDGPSVFGPNDYMAFPIGQIHWVGVLVVFILLVFKISKIKKVSGFDQITLFGILVGTGAAFMAHERSTFLWKIIPKLEFVQFPWRFLAINVFAYAFAIGSITKLARELNLVKSKFTKKLVFGLLLLVVVVFNWNFFSPIHSGLLTDDQKFSGEAWRIQKQAGILDYLPIKAKDDPTSAQEMLAEPIEGNLQISNIRVGTNWARFTTQGEDSLVRVNIFDFPSWKAFVDNKETEIFQTSNEEWGRIYINVPSGVHSVYLKLYDTPLRKVANIISLIAWSCLVGFLLYKWKKRTKIY